MQRLWKSEGKVARSVASVTSNACKIGSVGAMSIPEVPDSLHNGALHAVCLALSPPIFDHEDADFGLRKLRSTRETR